MAQNNITMNPVEGSIKDYLTQKSTNPCRTLSIPNPSTHSNIEHRIWSQLQIKSNTTISHKKVWPIFLDLQTPQNINIHKPYPNFPNKLNHTQYIYKKLKKYITSKVSSSGHETSVRCIPQHRGGAQERLSSIPSRQGAWNLNTASFTLGTFLGMREILRGSQGVILQGEYIYIYI